MDISAACVRLKIPPVSVLETFRANMTKQDVIFFFLQVSWFGLDDEYKTGPSAAVEESAVTNEQHVFT